MGVAVNWIPGHVFCDGGAKDDSAPKPVQVTGQIKLLLDIRSRLRFLTGSHCLRLHAMHCAALWVDLPVVVSLLHASGVSRLFPAVVQLQTEKRFRF